MKKLAPALALIILALCIFGCTPQKDKDALPTPVQTDAAQTAPVPDKYEIETAADCARYNDDVLRCAEWLRTTPYDPTKSGEWLRVAGFLTRWSAGTDEVMYEISEETAPVLGADLGVEKMSLLFSAYLAGGAE